MYDRQTDQAPAPVGPYSQVRTGGGLIFTAGFGPQDPVTGVVPPDIGGQTKQVLANVEAALGVYGATLADVIKATVHLQDLARDFDGFNAAYREVMSQPYPVRTTVGSDLASILVEIDVVAVAPQ